MDNPKAVPQAAAVKASLHQRGLVVCLALVGLIVGALGGTASAAPIAKNGEVNACYKVKGKTKGAMRVVPAKKKCKKGERKLAWSVAGPAGANGQDGAKGSAGATGGTGAVGPAGASGSSDEAALQAKISSLTLKVESLEGVLDGLTNGDLTSVVAKLDGVTGLQLTETVGALPVVDSLCNQAAAVPGQINAVATALGGLGLGGIIPLGLNLAIPSLTPVVPFTCPS